MQAWSLALGGWATALDAPALGDAQCGEQRGPDLQHIRTICVMCVCMSPLPHGLRTLCVLVSRLVPSGRNCFHVPCCLR